MCGFSPVVASGRFPWVASLVLEHTSRALGFQWLWFTDLVALRYVKSSQIRIRTHVSCIGRQILNTGPLGKPSSDLLKAFFLLVAWLMA